MLLQTIPQTRSIATDYSVERADIRVSTLDNGDLRVENTLTESMTLQGMRVTNESDESIVLAMDGGIVSAREMTTTTSVRSEPISTLPAVGLSDEQYARLAGEWRGPFEGIELFIRIETGADGARVATIEAPAARPGRMPIPVVTSEGNRVGLSLPDMGAIYTGILIGDSIAGRRLQEGTATAITFAR